MSDPGIEWLLAGRQEHREVSEAEIVAVLGVLTDTEPVALTVGEQELLEDADRIRTESERPVTVYEAAVALGGDARDVLSASAISVRPGSREAVRAAKITLGAVDAERLGFRWRVHQLRQFRTAWGRRRAVALLEATLTGEETEIPEDLAEALEHLRQADAQRPEALDDDGYWSYWDAASQYRAHVRALGQVGRSIA